MGCCGSTTAAPVHTETVEMYTQSQAKLRSEAHAQAQAEQQRQLREMELELESIRLKRRPWFEAVAMLLSKDNQNLVRLLGAFTLYSLGTLIKDEEFYIRTGNEFEVTMKECCTQPGCELKYGINKTSNEEKFDNRSSVVAAFQNTSVDREGHLYMSLLGAHWNKFDMYRYGYMSGLPYLSFNNNNAAYVNNRRIPKHMKLCDSGQIRTRAQPLGALSDRSTDLSISQTNAATRLVALQYANYWKQYDQQEDQGMETSACCLNELSQLSIEDESFSLKMNEILEDTVGFNKCEQQGSWQMRKQNASDKRTGVDFFDLCRTRWSEIRRDDSSHKVFANNEQANAAMSLLFTNSLRTHLDEYDLVAGTNKPFSQVFSSAECESLYLRKPNRLDYMLRRLDLLQSSKSKSLSSTSEEEEHDSEYTTGAHAAHMRAIRKASCNSAKMVDAKAQQKHKEIEDKKSPSHPRMNLGSFNIRSLEEVRYIECGCPDSNTENNLQSWLRTPLVTSEMLRRARCVVRRLARRNAAYIWKHKHAHSAYAQNKCARVSADALGPRRSVAGNAKVCQEISSVVAVSSAIQLAQVDRSRLDDPLSERELRVAHSLRIYASMQFFMYNLQESWRRFQVECKREEVKEANKEMMQRRADIQAKKDLENEQLACAKAEQQALLDSKMTEMFGRSVGSGEKCSSNLKLNESVEENVVKNFKQLAILEEAEIGHENDASGVFDNEPPKVSYRQMLLTLTPADIGHTTFLSCSTWGPLEVLIRIAVERTIGGCHDCQLNRSNSCVSAHVSAMANVKHFDSSERLPYLDFVSLPPAPGNDPMHLIANKVNAANELQRNYRRLLKRLQSRPRPQRRTLTHSALLASPTDLISWHSRFLDSVHDHNVAFQELCKSEVFATIPLQSNVYAGLLLRDRMFQEAIQVHLQVAEHLADLRKHILALLVAKRSGSALAVKTKEGINPNVSCRKSFNHFLAAGFENTGGLVTRPIRRVVIPKNFLIEDQPIDLIGTDGLTAELAQVLQASSSIAAGFSSSLDIFKGKQTPSFLQALVNTSTAVESSVLTPSAPQTFASSFERSRAGELTLSSGLGRTVRATEATLTAPVYLQSKSTSYAYHGVYGYYRENNFRIRAGTSQKHEVVSDGTSLDSYASAKRKSSTVLSQQEINCEPIMCWSVPAGSSSASDELMSKARAISNVLLSEVCPCMSLKPGEQPMSSTTTTFVEALNLVFCDKKFAPYINTASMSTRRSGTFADLHFEAQLSLDLSGHHGMEASQQQSSALPSAKLRVYAREKMDSSKTLRLSMGSWDSCEEIVLESVFILKNWRAVRMLTSGLQKAETTMILNWGSAAKPKRSRKEKQK